MRKSKPVGEICYRFPITVEKEHHRYRVSVKDFPSIVVSNASKTGA